MNYNLSRPLDVHRWSEYPEINTSINLIYDNYFKWQNPYLVKKHIKVVLLDLYVAWTEHQDMKLGVHMYRNAYKTKSRYNELHISQKTIDVVKRLKEVGLINLTNGFYDPTGFQSRITRIWSTKKLINQFKITKMKKHKIINNSNRETIILRNEYKKNIEYVDNEKSIKMRASLKEYNHLLSKTFIDIPELDKPLIKYKEKYIPISSNDCFITRIFNNSRWSNGGRFYGGWWQRIPSFYRSKIYINDEPTIEDDYKSLHPILLYAKKGLDYNKLNRGDAYDINIPQMNSKDDSRKLVKSLMLIAINAKDEPSTFRALKNELQDQLPNYSFNFKELRSILNKIKEKHIEIADDFCSGKGLLLMNIDGQITEYIINKFTQNNIPVLCIHDSFIVSYKHDNYLRKIMTEAIFNISQVDLPSIDRNGIGLTQLNSTKYLDRDYYLENIKYLSKQNQNKSNGYIYRKQLFKEYL